ncbi:MAG: cyclic nucleotide-binding domain-containing protein, partial [Proteobacteria bacterium]|nr:cyclic nucleotide-binding domain-containing protein [Pseudomonadota bacterium]
MVAASDLKQFELFGLFSEKQLEQLSKITEKKSFKKGSQIYRKSDRAQNIFVVQKGLVSLRDINPGDEVGIAFERRERGEFFGAACFMTPQDYTLTAVCMQDSEVMALDAEKLFELCGQDPDLGYKFMKKVAQIYFDRYKVAKRQIHAMVKAPTIITALP